MTLLERDFVQALLDSSTFAVWVGLPLVLLLLLSILGGALASRLLRGLSLRPLGSDERGSAVASDFALTVPVLALVVLAIFELASFMHSSLFVHYAAYSAARSVRLHAWDEVFPRSPFEYRVLDLSPDVKRRAAHQARLALIAAAPSTSERAREPRLAPVLASLARASAVRDADRTTAILVRKAAYAFHPDTVRVRVQVLLPPAAPVPTAHARVEFELESAMPMAKLLGERSADGRIVTRLHAEMSVL